MKKYFIFKLIASILSGILFYSLCPAQTITGTEYMFRNSLRDKTGNIWFGTTDKGLYRYDPKVEAESGSAAAAFTQFTERDGLLSNSISSIFEDGSGKIWLSTSNGVCYFNPATSKFNNFAMNESMCKSVSAILEDKKGNFWFGTSGYGICKYEPSTGVFTNYTMDQGLTNNFIQCFLEDKSGKIWIGTRGGGANCYDPNRVPDTGEKLFTNFTFEDCLQSQIMDIMEDKNNNLWFANLYGGVCRYEPSTGNFTHFNENTGFCNDTLTSIFQDRSGIIWFGIEMSKYEPGRGGVCCYNPQTGEFTTLKNFAGVTSSGVWTINEDKTGNIWIGTRKGLFRYEPNSGRFTNYTYKIPIK